MGRRLRWAKERFDDVDKSAAAGGSAAPRRSTSSLGAMSLLSRYFEILGSAQLFACERGAYHDDGDAFLAGGWYMVMIPFMHALILMGVVDLLAHVLNVPLQNIKVLRGSLFVPFLVASAWPMFNYEYLVRLRSRIQADPPDAVSTRRRKALWFQLISYLLGFLTILGEGVSRGWKHGP